MNGGQELVLAIKNRIGHVLQGEDGRPGILQSVESWIMITTLIAIRTHHHLNLSNDDQAVRLVEMMTGLQTKASSGFLEPVSNELEASLVLA